MLLVCVVEHNFDMPRGVTKVDDSLLPPNSINTLLLIFSRSGTLATRPNESAGA